MLGAKIETTITMRELRKHMEDNSYEIKELWFEFKNPEVTQVRIMFNYLYSKRMLFEMQI